MKLLGFDVCVLSVQIFFPWQKGPQLPRNWRYNYRSNSEIISIVFDHAWCTWHKRENNSSCLKDIKVKYQI